MTRETIPDDIAAFVVATFRTIADLEALVLLHDDRSTPWTPELVAARLYVSVDESQRVLTYLAERGLATRDERAFRFTPDPTTDAAVGRVVRFYSTHLIPITRLIHDRPATRVQQFADAFKLKKGD